MLLFIIFTWLFFLVIGFYALSNTKSDNPDFFIAWDDDDWRADWYPIFFLLANLGLMWLVTLYFIPHDGWFFPESRININET